MNEQRKRRKKKPVFQREGAVNQGVFEVPAVRTSWDTICPAGSALLAERFSVTWSQPIARFYEVGSNRIYYVGGRIGGRWGAGRIISPDALSSQFLKTFSVEATAPPALDCRELQTITLEEPIAPQAWSLGGVEVSAIGVQLHAERLAVQGDVAGLFSEFTS